MAERREDRREVTDRLVDRRRLAVIALRVPVADGIEQGMSGLVGNDVVDQRRVVDGAIRLAERVNWRLWVSSS